MWIKNFDVIQAVLLEKHRDPLTQEVFRIRRSDYNFAN
jgi:hypothetical protein